MRYHHIGIPTDKQIEGMRHVAELGMYHTSSESNPFGVVWVYFEPESKVSELVKRFPHVAFEVDDLDAALEGRQLLGPAVELPDGSLMAFVCHSEAPIAFLQLPSPSNIDIPTLHSKRLMLRPITVDDASSIFQLRSNPKVMKFMDHAPMASDTEAFDLIFRIAAEFKENETPFWAVARKAAVDRMIGYAGFIRWKKTHFRAEAACLLDPQHWGHGFATEALAQVLRYGFNAMRLHSVEANVNPKNGAAIALLKKLGFVREAMFKEDFYFQGRFVDSEVHSLLERRFRDPHVIT